MAERKHSTLGTTTASFDSMLKRFGVVTVMNANVYDTIYTGHDLTVSEIEAIYRGINPLCTLNTLKIANVTLEGPDKTVTGGQYSNPLIKFGKSARLEMQDALGNAEAVAYLGGGILEGSDKELATDLALHIGETFNGPKTIIGDSFFIDQKSGAQIPVKIIFYQMLPDSLFNLSQDAEGDATVFDLNGDLLTTDVKIAYQDKGQLKHQNIGLFYSIVDGNPDQTKVSIRTAKGTATGANTVVLTDVYDNKYNTTLKTVLKIYNVTTGEDISTQENIAAAKLGSVTLNSGVENKEEVVMVYEAATVTPKLQA